MMTRMTILSRIKAVCMIAPFILALAAAPNAWAQKAKDKSPARQQIEDRLEKRYATLFEAEEKGKVGETWQGFVEAVNSKDAENAIKKLIDDENADRKALYDLIAKEDKTDKKISAADVGERNAIRKFQKAKPDHFLKVKDGAWVQKRDVNRFKKDGKIGETAEGYLAPVKDDDRDDKVNGVVWLENNLRRDDYQRQAHRRNVSVDVVAEEAGKENLDKVAAGEWYKPKDGKWLKKSK